MAQEYGQRPSSIIGIADSWAAYQFDLLVLATGREIEARLIEGKRLDDLLLERGERVDVNLRKARGEFASARFQVR